MDEHATRYLAAWWAHYKYKSDCGRTPPDAAALQKDLSLYHRVSEKDRDAITVISHQKLIELGNNCFRDKSDAFFCNAYGLDKRQFQQELEKERCLTALAI